MKKLTASVLALCALLGAASQARADVPAILPFQGYLTDDAGAPIDGTLPFVFSLYGSLNGGAALFTETQSITVTGGFVNVYMGLSQPLDSGLFETTTTLYLGIRIDQTGEAEMVPRTQLGAVPYAFFAKACGDADTLEGLGSSAFAAASSTVTQRRVASTCSTGQSIRAINEDGTVVCEPDTDTDTDTTYSAAANGGLTLNSTVFSVSTSLAGSGLTMSGGVMHLAPDSGACTDGQLLKWNASNSTWTCLDDLDTDTDTDTLYTAASGGGLTLNATAFSVANGGVTANMLATGSVDSAELVAGAVQTSKLADGAVSSAKLADGAVGLRELGTLPSGNDVLTDGAFAGPADLVSTSVVSATGASATCMVSVSVALTPAGATTDTATVAVVQDPSVGATTASAATSVALPVSGSTTTTTAAVSHVFSLAAESTAAYGCRITPSGTGYDAGSATCNVSWLCF